MATGKLSAKKDAFCVEYMKDRSIAKAAVRAGYAKASASTHGNKMMKEPMVKSRIAELTKKAMEIAMISVADVASRYLMIATADINDIMSLEVAPCRFCYGKKGQYHWRTKAEFEETHQSWRQIPEAKRASFDEPTNEGGYGYRRKGDPCATCQRCDGRGDSFTVLKDTNKLPPASRALYAGVKQTQHGIEIKTHDQTHALDQVARFLGVFDDERKPGDEISTVFANFLKDLGKKGSPPAFGDKRLQDGVVE